MSNLPWRSCVAAFLYTPDGRFLLAEKPRKQHTWQLPQGGVEAEESLEQGLIREIEEELGLELSEVRQLQGEYCYAWPEDIQKERGYCGQIVRFFAAPLPEGEIRFNSDPHEPKGARIVTLPEALALVEGAAYSDIISQLYAQVFTSR